MTVMTPANAEAFAGLTIRKSDSYLSEDTGTHIVLYGQGGAGKTTLACDAALVGRTLLVDAEGGVDAVSHRTDIDVVELYNYRQFTALTAEVKKGTHPYKNIIIDNLCEVIDQALYQIAGPSPLTDIPEFKEWNQLSREIKSRTREWRDIARKQGINVFFIAWDADEKDDRGVIKKELAFTPALRKEFPGIVTIIGHVRVLADPNKRILDFAPSPKTVAKFRRNAKAASNEIPFQIEYDVNHLPMADILRTLRGQQKWPSTKYKAAGSMPANNRRERPTEDTQSNA